MSRHHDAAAVTEDVGYHGVFLLIDTPPSKMQLLRMKLTLPNGAELVVHGVGKHVVERGKSGARAAGIGVEFFGMDAAARRKWEAFVHDVSRVAGALVPERAQLVQERGQKVASEIGVTELSDDDLIEVDSDAALGDFEIEVTVSIPPAI